MFPPYFLFIIPVPVFFPLNGGPKCLLTTGIAFTGSYYLHKLNICGFHFLSYRSWYFYYFSGKKFSHSRTFHCATKVPVGTVRLFSLHAEGEKANLNMWPILST
jgi:hypothetical protein